MFNLKGKTALVTGSTRGIGKAIALELAKCEANVMIHGVAESELMLQTVAEIKKNSDIKVGFVGVDLSTKGAIKNLHEETIKQLGNIDIYVANASLQIEHKDWLNSTYDEFIKQMSVNVWSTIEMAQRLIPHMRKQRWGRILTIGSVQQTKPHHEMITYAASKSAQMNFVKNLSKLEGKYNILVNNIAPGFIDTDRNNNRTEESLNEIFSNIPLGKSGHTRDISPLAVLLCSDEARYITGSNFFVDGGANL